MSSLDNRLRELIIPELPESTIVIMASRQRPSIGWFDGDGTPCSRPSHWTGRVSTSCASSLLLTLVVGAQTAGVGSVAELADRLLGNEEERHGECRHDRRTTRLYTLPSVPPSMTVH